MVTDGQELQQIQAKSKELSSERDTSKAPADDTALQKPMIGAKTPEIESLNKILATKEDIAQVRVSLRAIIDSVADNPSLINRAAQAWGVLPLWQKVSGGIVIVLPTLVAGLAAHIGVLLAISGVTGFAYSAGGIVLDEHYSCNEQIKEKLTTGINGIVDLLELVIIALESIHKKLAAEIEIFKAENIKLTSHVSRLGEQVETLTIQVENYIKLEKFLRITQANLEQTTAELKETVGEQSVAFKKMQAELAEVKSQYEINQAMLNQKVVQLKDVREKMGVEVEKAKLVSAALKGTVDTLSGAVIDDKQQREDFQQRLNGFLTDKEAGFDRVAERVTDAERQLVIVKQELRESNARYQALLARQEVQIQRLERLDHKLAPRIVANCQIESLVANGIYAHASAGSKFEAGGAAIIPVVSS